MKDFQTVVKISLVAIVVAVVAACSGSSAADGDPKQALSAFIKGNGDVIAFGSAHLNDILNKADYKNVPKVGVILGGEIDGLKNMLDLNAPVYYALKGPFGKNDMPETSYAFLKVKNTDSLVAKLIQMGYDIDEDSEIKLGQDEGMAIGIKNGLAVIIIKEGDFDGKKLMESTFALTEGEASGGKIDEILASEGDIVMGVSLNTLYGTSSTDLQKLSKEKQKEIEAMVNGSYVQTIFKFEEGAAIIETKNFFTDEMMDRMFLNGDKSASMMAKLGKGEPRFGVSMNIDMKKMQKFMDEFSPNAAEELAASMGGPAQLALMSGGKDGLAGLFNGKFGVLVFGDEKMRTPNFNIHVGLAPNGVNIGSMAKDFLSYGDTQVDLGQSSISVYTNADYAPPGKLNLPKGCEHFGKGGFTAFFNLEGLDFDEMDLEGEANVLRVVKFMTIEYNNEGGRIYIKARDGKENVLEQAVEEIMNELADEISGMSI